MVAGVVGVVVLLTAGASVDATTEFGGAAREDAPHRPVVGAG